MAKSVLEKLHENGIMEGVHQVFKAPSQKRIKEHDEVKQIHNTKGKVIGFRHSTEFGTMKVSYKTENTSVVEEFNENNKLTSRVFVKGKDTNGDGAYELYDDNGEFMRCGAQIDGTVIEGAEAYGKAKQEWLKIQEADLAKEKNKKFAQAIAAKRKRQAR